MNNRGFTLIEMVLYLGIFSVIMVSLIPTFFAIDSRAADVRAETAALEDVIFIEHYIRTVLEDSEDILLPQPAASSSVLSVKNFSGAMVRLGVYASSTLSVWLDGQRIPLHATSTSITDLVVERERVDVLDALDVSFYMNGTKREMHVGLYKK